MDIGHGILLSPLSMNEQSRLKKNLHPRDDTNASQYSRKECSQADEEDAVGELPTKVRNELNMLSVLLIALFALPILGMAWGIYSWRLSHFPRSNAKIEAIRYEQRGKHEMALGVLRFQTIDLQGAKLDCLYEFVIGQKDQGFMVGQQLEVVTSPGECSRVDVLGIAKVNNLDK